MTWSCIALCTNHFHTGMAQADEFHLHFTCHAVSHQFQLPRGGVQRWLLLLPQQGAPAGRRGAAALIYIYIYICNDSDVQYCESPPQKQESAWVAARHFPMFASRIGRAPFCVPHPLHTQSPTLLRWSGMNDFVENTFLQGCWQLS